MSLGCSKTRCKVPAETPTICPKTAKSRKRRKIWFAFVTAMASTAVGLVVSEIVVRLVCGVPLPEGWPPEQTQPDVSRGWALVPNTVGYTYTFQVNINSLGLRERELSPKGPKESRILVLGDSLVFGQGIADCDTIPALMEQILNVSVHDKETTYRVVNAGLRAYSTNQELALLRQLGETIRPDVVVLVWYWNDIYEASIEEIFASRSVKAKRMLSSAPPWEWHLRELTRRSALAMLVHDVWYHRQPPFADSPVVIASLGRLENYLDEFISLAEKGEFKFVMALAPNPSAVSGSHPCETHAARIKALAELRDIPVTNLLDPLRQLYLKAGRLPIIPYDGHYNADGNRAMAESMAKMVLSTE